MHAWLISIKRVLHAENQVHHFNVAVAKITTFVTAQERAKNYIGAFIKNFVPTPTYSHLLFAVLLARTEHAGGVPNVICLFAELNVILKTTKHIKEFAKCIQNQKA